jgi:hypothetical protein
LSETTPKQLKSDNFNKNKAEFEYKKYQTKKPARIPYSPQNAKDVICFNCNKKGHYMKDCRLPKMVKGERKPSTNPKKFYRRGKACNVIGNCSELIEINYPEDKEKEYSKSIDYLIDTLGREDSLKSSNDK